MPSSDCREDFRRAIANAGLSAPDAIVADGVLHRFPSNGKRGDDAGWYVFHDDGVPAGSFGDWRRDFTETWRANIGRTLTSTEEAQHRARVAAMRQQREAETTERRTDARETAERIWEAATPAPADHPYLIRKGIAGHGLRVRDGRLIVPMRDGTELHSLQFIAADGDKVFLNGGRVSGCYYLIGTPDAVLCVAEGFATAATILDATGHAVVCAFNAGNLLAVAKAVRDQYPDVRLIVCADDDQTAGNPGVTAAHQAGAAVGALVAVPDFGDTRPDKATDFNDLHRHAGPDAVRRCVEAATVAEVATVAVANWPEPQMLATPGETEPYPLDVLPAPIRTAIAEVQAFTQAPVALVAGCALSALSLCGQALADVRRAAGLSGPVSLFLLTVADSGERKTATDRLFTAPVVEWERRQAEEAKPAVAEHRARLASWQAKREGLLAAVKQAIKSGKSTAKQEADLRDLEDLQPIAPRVPRLVRVDSTPEALAHALAHEWPSAAVQTAEAGTVLGGHAMTRDSQMRSLALLNTVWDGGSLHIARRTSPSYTLRGVRLTMGLQAQPAAVSAFVDQSDGLARGMGFLARFLPAWPETTQGTRAYREPPTNWPALNEYTARLVALLDTRPTLDDDGALSLPVLDLSDEAKALWVRLHDDVERELSAYGELAEVRDTAAKAADNCVRLAALLHIYAHGPAGTIGPDYIAAAGRVVTWHLIEARRFFRGLAVPVAVARALRLDAWLLAHCQQAGTDAVSTRDVQRLGPVRDRHTLDAAIAELVDAGRVRLDETGRERRLLVNPALLGGHHGPA